MCVLQAFVFVPFQEGNQSPDKTRTADSSVCVYNHQSLESSSSGRVCVCVCACVCMCVCVCALVIQLVEF